MSKNKLWQTGKLPDLLPSIASYTVGNDAVVDQKLLRYDIQATSAHVHMLESIGVLTKQEHADLATALQELSRLVMDGKFEIGEYEDGHTAIESYLSEHCGEAGQKIHTGRSRNDQALVMLRLYMKDQLSQAQKLLEALVATTSQAAKKHSDVPMPGYTHMQKAMPTTVGVWLGSYGDAWQDCLASIEAASQLIDQNPLGSAAGFGINNLKLNRELTTKELGFAKTQENAMYCGLSRGMFEAVVLSALSQTMILASRFAADMLLFTTQEFSYLSLPDSCTTGSSIMPQKRNYDVFEIMRGNAARMIGIEQQVKTIVSGIGSGYQRDLQLTKGLLIEGIELTQATLRVLAEVVPLIEPDEKRLQEAMTDDLYLTEKVYELVADGMPFRAAYRQIKLEAQD